MSADWGLASTALLDCQGQVTHRLTLEVDGTVTVTFVAGGGHHARVDPVSRRTLTPGITVPDAIIAEAATLRPG